MQRTIIKLTITPTFGLPGEKTQIDVIEKDGDSYHLKLSEWRPDGFKSSKKLPLSSIDAERLICDLTTTGITPISMPPESCDGSFISLEIKYWGAQSKFTWMNIAPDNWQVLDDVAGELCAIAGLDE